MFNAARVVHLRWPMPASKTKTITKRLLTIVENKSRLRKCSKAFPPVVFFSGIMCSGESAKTGVSATKVLGENSIKRLEDY